jgi:hypothetical protein
MTKTFQPLSQLLIQTMPSAMSKATTTLLLAILTLISGTTAQAQTSDLVRMNMENTARGSGTVFTYNHNYGVVLGSPFLHEEWSTGTVRARDGNVYTDISMRFEAWNGLVNIVHQADSVWLRPEFVTEFSYNQRGQQYTFRNGFIIPSVDVTRNQYLHILHEGEWSVYRDVKKNFRPADRPEPYQANRQTFDSFQENIRFLVRTPDDQWSEIRPGRRTINRLFGDLSRDVNAYIRRNDLSYTNEEHLALIFAEASRLAVAAKN